MIVRLNGDGKVDKEKSNSIGSGFLCDTVGDLPVGRGKGVLLLKNGRKVEVLLGRVVRRKETKEMVVVLENLEKKNGKVVVKETFASNTQFISWELHEACMFCAFPCNGICDSIDPL